MQLSALRQEGPLYRVSYTVLLVLLTFLVFCLFLSIPGINGYYRAMFGDMVYGTAYKPFVYRTLLPTTVRVLASAIPSAAKMRLTDALSRNPAMARVATTLEWEREYLVEYCIASLLMYAALWAFLFSLRYLFASVLRAPPRFADLIPLLALVGLPIFFKYYSYLYDFATLFLFTLGLALMARRNWTAYLLLYPISCINKETTILLALVFAIHFASPHTMSRRLFTRLLVYQIAAFLVIKAALAVIFRHNPGNVVEVYFDRNLTLLVPYTISRVATWLVIAMATFANWPDKPRLLKDALWIAVPLWILTWLFGNLDELRALYEVYPIILLLMAHTFAGILGVRLEHVEAPRAAEATASAET
jgi:hypothetical protein